MPLPFGHLLPRADSGQQEAPQAPYHRQEKGPPCIASDSQVAARGKLGATTGGKPLTGANQF